MKQEILETLWGWINDNNHIVNGICYELNDRIIGIAHYRIMLPPIKGKYIGFLDDLFVETNFRGQKIAQKLINHYLKTIIGMEFVGSPTLQMKIPKNYMIK